MVVLGGGVLSDLREGARISVSIHEIHDGPPLVTFAATVHELDTAQISLGLFGDVVGNRRLDTSYASAKTASELLSLIPA
jgi:hypothetical protein